MDQQSSVHDVHVQKIENATEWTSITFLIMIVEHVQLENRHHCQDREDEDLEQDWDRDEYEDDSGDSVNVETATGRKSKIIAILNHPFSKAVYPKNKTEPL